MKKIKVMPIFGTRPDAIKMCPLIHELRKHDNIETVVCVTGQHREMLLSVLEFFNIVPEYNLDIMRPNQTLETITTDIIEKLSPVLKEEKPDIVLVHGDTSTAFAAAVTAFYNKIPVGHVEAGLRSYDKWSPYPEEMNRRIVGSIADLHFIPTPMCKEHLLRENITEGLYITGNTEIDAVGYTVSDHVEFPAEIADKLDPSKKLIFVTAHRRENIGEPLEAICRALGRIVDDNKDTQLIYLVHLNPKVQETVHKILDGKDRIILASPQSPFIAHNLLARSYLILTDSGGIQEDAPALKKPVLVLRQETERPEGIEAGTARLAGTDEDTIYNMACALLNDTDEYNKMANAKNPYGDGTTSARICQAILHHFGLAERPKDYI